MCVEIVASERMSGKLVLNYFQISPHPRNVNQAIAHSRFEFVTLFWWPDWNREDHVGSSDCYSSRAKSARQGNVEDGNTVSGSVDW